MDEFGNTPLYYASARGQYDRVRALLEKGDSDEMAALVKNFGIFIFL